MMMVHRIVLAVLLLLGVAVVPAAEPEPLSKGVLLVATDLIQEGNFHRSVVLLLTYGEGGAVGVIINRPSNLPLDRLLPDLRLSAGHGVRVWQGGPVDPGRMLFLVRSGDPVKGAARAFGDVHISHDRKLLDKVLRKKKYQGRFKIIAGYAGWAPGQLESEIRRGGWKVVPAGSDEVFTADPLGLWDRYTPDREV